MSTVEAAIFAVSQHSEETSSIVSGDQRPEEGHGLRTLGVVVVDHQRLPLFERQLKIDLSALPRRTPLASIDRRDMDSDDDESVV